MKTIGIATLIGAGLGLTFVYWLGSLNNPAIALVLLVFVSASNGAAHLIARWRS